MYGQKQTRQETTAEEMIRRIEADIDPTSKFLNKCSDIWKDFKGGMNPKVRKAGHKVKKEAEKVGRVVQQASDGFANGELEYNNYRRDKFGIYTTQ